MANLNMNKVIIAGRIVRDLELKQTSNGLSYLKFTVAVNRRAPKDANNNQPTADFISCTAWKQSAENIAKYFQKGSCICIAGKIQVSTYEKDGAKRSTTDVLVDEFYFVDGKNDSKTESPAPTQTQPAQNVAAPAVEIIENDDLPF